MSEVNVFSAENLSKRYGERLLFEGLTFGLSVGQKTALVAKNGSGKTTLLNGICGIDHFDEGRISVDGSIRWSYLPQNPQFSIDQSILDHLYASDLPAIQAMKSYAIALEKSENVQAVQKTHEDMDATQAWDFEARAKEVLGKLNLHDLNRTMGSLSGGERRRVALARVLIEEPDILFLDEPTNHLDLDMINWLERHLAQSRVTLFMITHDRYFLENVCDTIFELDEQTLFKYKGNYQYFLEKREDRKNNALANRSKARSSFRRELEWMRSTPSARTGKSKSRIERFYEIKQAAKKRLEEDQMTLQLNPHRLGGKIIELHNVKQSFGDRVLFASLTYHFKKGDRLGIIGQNGSGKSTLLDVITQQRSPSQGKVIVGETVVFGYYNQAGANFPEGQKMIEAIYEIAEFMPLQKGQKITAAQLLERFMFPRSSHHQLISSLSGGERKRLHLLQVLMGNPNVLILDEPTNDLDIYTLQVLEEFLLDFPGCLIIVSHDRYFMDRLVEHIWIVGQEDTIQQFPGNYSEYRIASKERQNEKDKIKSNDSNAEENTNALSHTPKNDYSNRLSYKEKFEFDQLEGQIEKLEQEKTELTDRLYTETDPEKLQSIGLQLKEITDELEQAENRWLELSERA